MNLVGIKTITSTKYHKDQSQQFKMQNIHNYDCSKTYNYVIYKDFKDFVVPNLSSSNNRNEISHTMVMYFYTTKTN